MKSVTKGDDSGEQINAFCHNGFCHNVVIAYRVKPCCYTVTVA